MHEVVVDGFAHDRFAPLADVFARGLTRIPVGGAALSVISDGRPVVELRGGDYAAGLSRQVLFSVSKLVTAAAAWHAVHRGSLDLDRPLAEYWPDLDRDGVRAITTRMVLSHRSGLIGLNSDRPFDDLISGGFERELAQRAVPAWTPGEDHGYHAWSFGALIDGALRRTSGSGVSDWIRDVLNPVSGAMLTLAEPGSAATTAPLLVEEIRPTPLQRAWADDPRRRVDAVAVGALSDISRFNDPRLMEANWPAATVIGEASDVARALSAVIDGSLFPAEVTAAGIRTVISGLDRVLGIPTSYGLGVQLPSAHLPFLGRGSFGHEGAGGAIAAASPDHRLVVAVTTNRLAGAKGAADMGHVLMAAVRHCHEQGENR